MLRIILTAACVIGIISYGLLSYHVLQPKKLEKARAFAGEERYAEAETAYQSLAEKRLFSNPDVKEQARNELIALLNQWAEILVEQGDRKTAFEKYAAAGNTEAVLANRRAYAEESEEKGLLQEAIEQYEQLPDANEKVSELYAKLVKQSLEQENYELALNSFNRADPELLKAYQITKAEIYRQWGKALADQGRTDDAIQKLEKADRSSDEVLALLRTLYIRQAEEKGRKLLEQWQKQGSKTDTRRMQLFAEVGAQFHTIDAQLHYWSLLSEAEIDIDQVYPQGVEVNDFMTPTNIGTFDSFDVSKPLVFQRIEKEYTISFLQTTFSSLHDPQDPAYYTVTLLPELWQRLPKERRAASLQECTCILILNMTYQPAGTYSGTYRVKNYAAEMARKQSYNTRGLGTMPQTLESSALFSLFTARMNLLLWNYPENEMKVLDGKSNEARYKPNSWGRGSMVVDWSKQESSLSVSTIKLGLSGAFDKDWLTETAQKWYETLLAMGGE